MSTKAKQKPAEYIAIDVGATTSSATLIKRRKGWKRLESSGAVPDETVTNPNAGEMLEWRVKDGLNTTEVIP